MTGRELILYILINNLEDEPIFKDGVLIGHMGIDEAAAKFGVGKATIKVWLRLGIIDGVEIGESIYIGANTTPNLEQRQIRDISKEDLNKISKSVSSEENNYES